RRPCGGNRPAPVLPAGRRDGACRAGRPRHTPEDSAEDRPFHAGAIPGCRRAVGRALAFRRFYTRHHPNRKSHEMTDATAASPRHRATLSAVAILVLLEAALIVSWSAGFVGIRFAIDHAPIFLILLWRSLISGLFLLPFALTLGPKLRLK